MGSMTIETNSFETIHLRPFIWDHVHLRPVYLRPLHLRPRSFQTFHLGPHSFWTFSFETTFIWDHIHLRPHSFETTFIWDHSHLRPPSFETTVIWDLFIWDHIHLRPHSFEATFIWDYINLRSQLFYAMLKSSCFDLLCTTFYYLPFTFLRETWSFPRWLFIWNFARLRPSVSRGDSHWFVNAPALRSGSRGGSGGNWPGPLTPRGHPVMIIICFK